MDFFDGHQPEKTGFGNGAPPHCHSEESALVPVEEVRLLFLFSLRKPANS
jgi:hypothetical protein